MTLAVSSAIPASTTRVEPGPTAVSVIIPVRNGVHHLKRTLPALREALPHNWEIIVVDDSSRDASRRIALLYADNVIASGGGRGAPTARNRGAEVARGDILVFLDADIVVTHKGLLDLVSGLNLPGVALTFGIYSEGRHLATFGGRFKSVWVRYSYLNSPNSVRWMNTAMAAMRKRDFNAVGGFRNQDDWLHGGNDIDFGRNVSEKVGIVRLLHGVECDHLKELTLGGLLRNDFFRTRGFFRTAVQSREINRSPGHGYGNISPAFMGGVLAAGSVPFAIVAGIMWPPLFGTAVLALAVHSGLSAGFYRYAVPRLGPGKWSAPMVLFADHLACFAGLLAEAISISNWKSAFARAELQSGPPLPLDSGAGTGRQGTAR